jgi:phi13 family phage major tail protein
MYYAIRTTGAGGAYTYGTPKRLRGARQLTINAEGTNEKFYADNGVYYIADSNTGKSGSLELAGINDEALMDIFGYIKDANGVILEDADAHSKDVALLFECENDGTHPTRFSMFDVKFTRPTEEHNTKEDSVAPDTITMDYEAAPCELPWGNNDTKNFVGGHIDYVEASGTEGQEGYDPGTVAIYDAWYSAVTLPAKGE